MFEQLLSIGVSEDNTEVLNRKIRTSNLVALSTMIILTSFSPLFFYFLHPLDLMFFGLFYSSAILNFFLVKRRYYMQAFTTNIVMAYIYFFWGTMAYGWNVNLQFYLLVMCMIVVIFYDNKSVIKLFIAFSIIAFFGLLFLMKDRRGLIDIPAEFDTIKQNMGYANLFVLFVIISILIFFFKNQNLHYQERITEASKIIAEKNKEMLDSINYAQRIQSGLLPAKKELSKLFPDSFLYFRPKDIVSGDFYWFYKNADVTYIACGDCTGHGVPGALMSVLGINLLSDIVESAKATEPDEILNQLRNGIVRSLNKENTTGEYKDGMDISVIKVDAKNLTCSFAGANNSIYQISGGELTEYKATKQPVGFSPDPKPFSNNIIQLKPNDYIVLFTDGFADQFGGLTNKKYMYKSFKEFLKQVTSKPGIDIDHALHDEFTGWRANVEQIDDVCVVGIRV